MLGVITVASATLYRLAASTLLLILSAFFLTPVAAQASSLTGHPCHALTAREAALPPSRAALDCSSAPTLPGSGEALWLRYPVRPGEVRGQGAELLVHQTRFDRLAVHFVYADGGAARHEVRRGAFGDHWRVGGQIAFAAPARAAQLTAVYLKLEGLASYELLRVRLLPGGEAGRETSLIAALAGGALALLALSLAYNSALAVAVRASFIAWHAAWVGTVLVWGLLWSQLALLALPDIAGTTASKLGTTLSTLAITFASLSALGAIGRAHVTAWLRHLIVVLAVLTAALGAAANLVPAGWLELVGSVLGGVVLAGLSAVAAALVLGWRRGSAHARDFVLAWALPMAVLAATQILDFGTALMGGGAQFAVLLACALQTLWLSVVTTLRLSAVRGERDAARAAQAELHELSIRDPLTGLLNRRGFVSEAQRLISSHEPFALLVIDVDHFKLINDRFGHDVGDEVLQRLASEFASWGGEGATPARLGGEEFGVLLRGRSGEAVRLAAEALRSLVRDIAFEPLFGEERHVTVSIGAADGAPATSFETLYRAADQALYAAKREGRDRVACASVGGVARIGEDRTRASG